MSMESLIALYQELLLFSHFLFLLSSESAWWNSLLIICILLLTEVEVYLPLEKGKQEKKEKPNKRVYLLLVQMRLKKLYRSIMKLHLLHLE